MVLAIVLAVVGAGCGADAPCGCAGRSELYLRSTAEVWPGGVYTLTFRLDGHDPFVCGFTAPETPDPGPHHDFIRFACSRGGVESGEAELRISGRGAIAGQDLTFEGPLADTIHVVVERDGQPLLDIETALESTTGCCARGTGELVVRTR